MGGDGDYIPFKIFLTVSFPLETDFHNKLLFKMLCLSMQFLSSVALKDCKF